MNYPKQTDATLSSIYKIYFMMICVAFESLTKLQKPSRLKIWFEILFSTIKITMLNMTMNCSLYFPALFSIKVSNKTMVDNIQNYSIYHEYILYYTALSIVCKLVDNIWSESIRKPVIKYPRKAPVI